MNATDLNERRTKCCAHGRLSRVHHASPRTDGWRELEKDKRSRQAGRQAGLGNAVGDMTDELAYE